jgi:hypothetical protein
MTLRSKKHLLWLLSASLAAAGLGSVLALALVPIGEPDPASLAPAAPQSVVPPARKTAVIAYDAIGKRNLQQPLYDSAAPNQPPPKPTVKLVGTVLEPGFTYAMLKTKDGQVKGVSVGETVDGAEVTEVKVDSVTVKFAGEMHTLKVESPGAGS